MHRLFLVLFSLLPLSGAAEPAAFQDAACEGEYPRHLQGICTNDRDAIYWSWTTFLVKTDGRGRILKRVPVADHHGDLCYVEGKVHVAVNLGKFNQPPGKADSWVYVYDGETLAETARHPVPELVHGAGGMAHHDGKFLIVGGLPPGSPDNLLYEYDESFVFQRRRVLSSGYTLMGIQTVAYGGGAWWFGCYGKPRELLKADEKGQFQLKREFDASVGVVALPDGRFLVGSNKVTGRGGNVGTVRVTDL